MYGHTAALVQTSLTHTTELVDQGVYCQGVRKMCTVYALHVL